MQYVQKPLIQLYFLVLQSKQLHYSSYIKWKSIILSYYEIQLIQLGLIFLTPAVAQQRKLHASQQPGWNQLELNIILKIIKGKFCTMYTFPTPRTFCLVLLILWIQTSLLILWIQSISLADCLISLHCFMYQSSDQRCLCGCRDQRKILAASVSLFLALLKKCKVEQQLCPPLGYQRILGWYTALALIASEKKQEVPGSQCQYLCPESFGLVLWMAPRG